jgi:hypothetical protein
MQLSVLRERARATHCTVAYNQTEVGATFVAANAVDGEEVRVKIRTKHEHVRREQRLRMHELVVRTLADLGEQSRLAAYCPSCRRSQFLDLEALRARYGAELSLRNLRARLRCSRCGARRPEVIHVWDNGARFAGH